MEIVVSSVDPWLETHLERKFGLLKRRRRLTHMDISKISEDAVLLIGFEQILEFTEFGILGDVLSTILDNKRIKKMIAISSYGVYEETGKPFCENEPASPMNLFGTRALLIESIANYNARRSKIPLIILRLFNVFGPYQTSPYVVPTILERIVKKGVITIGDSEKTRDFIYVNDLLDLLSLLIDLDYTGIAVYNVGSGIETSIHKLIIEAQEVTGGECDVLFDATKLREEYDYDYAVADITKIKKELGWEPKVSLEEGLALTYQWILGRSGK